MARYIDAEMLKERIEYYYSHTDVKITSEAHYAYGVALKEINKTPTEDVVPVVRCKDCKYCIDYGMSGLFCNHADDRNPLGCRPDDYCNCGERKQQ